jgi:hypothetical protein
MGPACLANGPPAPQPLGKQRNDDSHAAGFAREMSSVGQPLAGVMERLPRKSMLFGERPARRRQGDVCRPLGSTGQIRRVSWPTPAPMPARTSTSSG